MEYQVPNPPTEDKEKAMTNLEGRVFAVTGGSSGIGAALGPALAETGAKVVLGARRRDRLTEIIRPLGDAAHAVEMDVSRPDDSRRLVQETIDTFGKIDGIIANAGIGMYGGILDNTDDELAEMLDTNVAGTVWPIRAAVPHLREQGEGDIIIVSSVAGLRGAENEAVYAATKHAQVGLAGGLDRELHRENIRVSTICPGGVATEFAMGKGRTEGAPELDDMMSAREVADVIVSVLERPRNLRTLVYSLRGIVEPD